MKRMGLIAASLILLIGVTGCSLFPTGESYSWGEKEAEVTIAADGATGKLSDSLVVNATINEPKNVEWKKYNVEQAVYTNKELEDMADRLKGNNRITKKNVGDEYYNCEYSDGSSFGYNIQDGIFGMSYDTKQAIRVQYEAMISNNNAALLAESQIKEIFPNDTIEGLSKETAMTQGKETCSRMGINIDDSPYICVAMDYENANKELEINPNKAKDKNGNAYKWTKSDDAYYMIFKRSIDGIPISIESKNANFYAIPKASVVVIVGRQGVVEVNIRYAYKEKLSENVTVIDSQKALNILATDTMYAAIGDMVLTNLSLEYVVYKDLKTKEDYIKPMWVYTFERTTTTEKNGETYTRTSKQTNFIDVVTGQVLGG